MWDMKKPKFKRVDTANERKLKYAGFCSKCNKITFHRWDGGSIYNTRYRCMKCKTINIENDKA
jgi:hypothetical protein